MADRYPVWLGRYLLVESVGAGGFGTVHFGLRSGDDELVVVKTLRADLIDDDEARRRFAHEARISMRLDGPAFARVYEAGVSGELPYLAMQYVFGCPLRKVMKRIEGRSPLAMDAAAQLALGVVDAVSALHELRADGERLDIVHRDLSPSNLIVTPERGVRLIDLGIGRSALQDAVTRTGAVVGSPGYLSPEQVLAAGVDQRSDQFACAVIVWELFAGRRLIPKGPLAPVLARTVKQPYLPLTRLRPCVPRALDAVLAKALEKDAERRFGTVAELRSALEPIFASLSAGEPDATPFADVFAPSHDRTRLDALQERARSFPASLTGEETALASAVPSAAVSDER